MNFLEAWEEAKKGKNMRRKEWSNADFFLDINCVIREMISGHQELQDLVNEITADDWVVV